MMNRNQYCCFFRLAMANVCVPLCVGVGEEEREEGGEAERGRVYVGGVQREVQQR